MFNNKRCVIDKELGTQIRPNKEAKYYRLRGWWAGRALYVIQNKNNRLQALTVTGYSIMSMLCCIICNANAIWAQILRLYDTWVHDHGTSFMDIWGDFEYIEMD